MVSTRNPETMTEPERRREITSLLARALGRIKVPLVLALGNHDDRAAFRAQFQPGAAEPEAIRDAIEATENLVGTTGIVTMAPDDHLGLDLDAFRMLEIRDGGWTLID